MLDDILISFGSWIRGHLFYVSMMISATVLVIWGGDINRIVRNQVQTYHFVVRTTVFVLLCAFGYGLLLNWLAPFLHFQLAQVSSRYLGVLILGIMIGLGMIAERKRC
ncbi:DUF3392 domain-containing protein [Aliidiomarina sanyensis]|uniref:DUF3392 domain-containing protein n=1 Tax=Aliidiomarina sanyensis TaxID=1249555 RepID=A0A432WNP6_9GAMM|nr:DUF3392 domain-containing protein [Aliidiomarina sanyensis]